MKNKLNIFSKEKKQYEPEYFIQDTKSIRNYIDDETLKTLKIIGISVIVFIIAAIVGSLTINEKKAEAPKKVEFNVPDSGDYKFVSTSADGKYAYINSISYNYGGGSNTYVVKNEYGKWSDAKKLNFGKDIYPYGVRVSKNCEDIYFSGIETDALDDTTSEEGIEINLYRGKLDGEKVTDIKEIDCDNDDSDIKIIICEYKDKGIYYCSMGESGNQYYLVDIESGECSNIGLTLESQAMACGFYSPRYDQMYLFAADILQDTLCERINIKDGKRGNSERVLVNGLAYDDEDIMCVSLSGDGKTIYYNLSDGSIYQLSLDSFINGYSPNKKPKMAKYEGTIYDEYDTSDFETVYRNKGDMSAKQGVYYEIFVRGFADSDGDGIGDFNGITAKLDYLKELGVDGLWLMPINASSSYHGYDVSDYYALNSDYGTEEDFKKLLDEAHNRGISVIMDFVINHTGIDNKWFTESCKGDSNKYRNYYRWVVKEDTVDYNKKDVAPWGCSVWYKCDNAFYYSIFYGGMPDLNYNNKDVREEVKKAAGKWLNLGVDGFRLDAAIHIYGVNEFKQIKDRDAHNIQWWNEFAGYCESINPNVYLVGEAWEDDNIFAEYAQPFDTKFNFTFEQNMIYAVLQEKSITKDKKDLAQSLKTVIDEYAKYDTDFIDGVFGTNHDQDRILSQVYKEEKAKLIANIYLTLPGNPFIYYGEEIGMKGNGNDENKRTSFKWSMDNTDLDASWIKDNTNKELEPWSEQKDNESSMYNHYKRIIALRKSEETLLNGSYNPVDSGNESVLAYERIGKDDKILVIHNLSQNTTSINVSEDYNNSSVIYGSETGSVNSTNVTLSAYSTLIIKKSN